MHVTYPITSQREMDVIFKKTFDKFAAELLSAVGIKQSAVTITTASYTLTNDQSDFFIMNSGSAQTFNLPQDLDKWDVGSVLSVVQLGAGLVTIDPGTNVTVNGGTTNVVSAGRYSVVKLLKVGANAWVILGGAAA